MTIQESLERFGTITFGTEFMKRTIDFGTLIQDPHGVLFIEKQLNPHCLQFGLWLNFVPEAYQLLANKSLEMVMSNLPPPSQLGVYTIIDTVISLLQFEIIKKLKSGEFDYLQTVQSKYIN